MSKLSTGLTCYKHMLAKWPVCWKCEIDALRARVKELEEEIKDLHKSFGCELRDPYGTIWEQCAASEAANSRILLKNRRYREALEKIAKHSSGMSCCLIAEQALLNEKLIHKQKRGDIL